MRLPEALALGVLHGPAELLPISSSGHTALIPWLARWEYAELDPELRKAFEIALHAGTAAALLVALRDEVAEAAGGFDRRRLELVAGSFIVPAIVGLALERPIERGLGGPRSIAAGLLAGSLAMVAADRDRGCRAPRTRDDATLIDALALGVAQACALVPGVSRNGATLAAARARGFGRHDASVLSRHVALPIIAGATLLKTVRLARRGLPREERAAFAAGTAAAFVSTLASVRLVRDGRPLWPFAAYRTALAGVVLWEHGRR
ncbi:MAG TPA: undecaprenyl-diphosphate phosphatase [Solirubrobacteraceae bacterium]|nr:undecaprenyl-diphosphate phosphatase [Solirubrobacteraceae bacterium]